MRKIVILSVFFIIGCKSDKAELPRESIIDSIMRIVPDSVETIEESPLNNARYRKIVVQKLAENTYQINGQSRAYEGTVSWVVEDGHNELAHGFTTATIGAPEWGTFSFVVNVEKARENSTLHLILYQESPKDGTRQYQLFVPLN